MQYSWNVHLRKQHGIDLQITYACGITALAIVRPGVLFDTFVHWSREGDWFRRSFDLPLDVAALHVVEVWVPHNTERLQCEYIRAKNPYPHQAAFTRLEKAKHQGIWEPHAFAIHPNLLLRDVHGNIRNARDVLQDIPGGLSGDGCTALPVLRLPLPISLLVRHGAWKSLFVCARWGVPHGITSLFPGWEPWVATRHGENDPQPDMISRIPSAGDFQRCAHFLRDHAQVLIENDEDGQVSYSLHQALSMLDAGARCMQGMSRKTLPGNAGRGARITHTASRLWHAFHLASKLKTASDLSSVLKMSLRYCFPGANYEWSEEHIDKVVRPPSSSSIRRAGLFIDCAWIMAERQATKDKPVVRFGWADSSPQAGQDWLICTTDIVEIEKILQVSNAAKQLANMTIDLEEVAVGDLEDVQRLSATIANNIRRHTAPPCHVPDQKSALSFKVALCLH